MGEQAPCLHEVSSKHAAEFIDDLTTVDEHCDMTAVDERADMTAVDEHRDMVTSDEHCDGIVSAETRPEFANFAQTSEELRSCSEEIRQVGGIVRDMIDGIAMKSMRGGDSM